jgi:DNA-binding CsgD family transcriptional regulator/tetratricopeptide (TPR) repeat protein
VESKEGQLGLRLARTVQFLWQARGYLSEGLAWLDRLLVLPGAEASTPARAVCLLAAGRLATLLGRMEAARTFYEAGLPLARTINEPWIQWLGPQNVGVHAMSRGDLETAARYFREALAIARASGDRVDEAISLGTLATTAWFQRDDAEAQQLAEASRTVAHAMGEDWTEGLALRILGWLALLRGDHATARIEFEQALDVLRQQGDPFQTALALEGLGQVAMAQAEHKEAHARLAESLRLLGDFGSRKDIADCLESFAALAAAQSISGAALQLAGAAEAIRDAIGAVQTPLRRELLERWLSVVRRSVAVDVYARKWATGLDLTVQQAIALALGLQATGAADSSTSIRPESVELSGLTAREVEVLRLVARGQSNKEIAAELVLSVRTVERHITNLYGKIDARGKADATAYAIRHGFV